MDQSVLMSALHRRKGQKATLQQVRVQTSNIENKYEKNYIFNRPGVAGAVLETPSLLIN